MAIYYQDSSTTVFVSQLFKTTSTIIQTDDLVLVVDPNWLPLEVAKIRDYVDSIKGNRPIYLLFTHSDYDHIIGYEAFLDATVIASEAFANNPKKEEILQQILQFDHDYYIEREYQISYPAVDIIIKADRQILQIGRTTMQFYLAPGHNRDGIITIVKELQTAIVGDYLCAVEFPFIYHSSQDYLETLEKLKHLILNNELALLVAGHGPVFTDPKMMLKELKKDEHYIYTIRDATDKEALFDEDWLWKQYKFPLLQKQFHLDNIKLIKKEKDILKTK